MLCTRIGCFLHKLRALPHLIERPSDHLQQIGELIRYSRPRTPELSRHLHLSLCSRTRCCHRPPPTLTRLELPTWLSCWPRSGVTALYCSRRAACAALGICLYCAKATRLIRQKTRATCGRNVAAGGIAPSNIPMSGHAYLHALYGGSRNVRQVSHASLTNAHECESTDGHAGSQRCGAVKSGCTHAWAPSHTRPWNSPRTSH